MEHLATLLVTAGLILTALSNVKGQVPENFTVEIDGPSRLNTPTGAKASFTCRLGIGRVFQLKYKIQWLHISGVREPSSEERIISENDNVIDRSSSGKYVAEFQTVTRIQEPAQLDLQVNQVTDRDDGRYVCRVIGLQGDKTGKEAEAYLIVIHDAERVELSIDDDTPITSPSASPLELKEGRHSVRCSALGFNPSDHTTVSLSLDGKPLIGDGGTEKPKLLLEESKEAGAPRYKVEKRLTWDLSVQESGQTLSCVGLNSREGTTITASTVITVTKNTDTDAGGNTDSSTTKTNNSNNNNNNNNNSGTNSGEGTGDSDSFSGNNASSSFDLQRWVPLLASFVMLFYACL